MYHSSQSFTGPELVCILLPRFRSVVLMLVCLALPAAARAQVFTCPGGCDPRTNTFSGNDAFMSNTTGSDNTASGALTLDFKTSGIENTAVGFQALAENTTGSNDTAIGVNALGNKTTGSNNTASVNALQNNTTGSHNTAAGSNALELIPPANSTPPQATVRF